MTLPAEQPSLVAFYGTLLSPFPTLDRLGIRHKLRLSGPCLIAGRLVDLSLYPGLIQGEGQVRGEVHRILDPAALAVLDRFEGYDPSDPEGSEYLRLATELTQPGVTAWVYWLKRTPRDASEIPGGDWTSHWQAKAAADPEAYERFFSGRPA